MNLKDISTQLLFTTVKIVSLDSSGQAISVGTGFIYSLNNDKDTNSSIPLIITNYHVVKNCKSIQLTFHKNSNSTPSKELMSLNFIIENTIDYKLKGLDIFALPLAPFLRQLKDLPYYIQLESSLIPDKKIVDDLQAIEDVVIIGYPSGLSDTHSGFPIVRKGITATPIWNDFKNTPMFLIDATVVPGSSGSPVFIYNQGSYASKKGITIGTRLYFIGVLTRNYKNTNTGESIDLGQVIKSDKILDVLKEKYL